MANNFDLKNDDVRHKIEPLYGYRACTDVAKTCTVVASNPFFEETFVFLQKTTAKMNAATDVVSKEAVLNSLSKMPDQIPIDTLLDESSTCSK